MILVAERLVLREAVGQLHEIDLDARSTSRHVEVDRPIGEQITVSLLQLL